MSQTAVYPCQQLDDHHGLFSNSWGVPRLQLLSQKPSRGSFYTESNFPLDKCDLSTLTEARILIREDMRRAVRHYNSHQARFVHANKSRVLPTGEYGFGAPKPVLPEDSVGVTALNSASVLVSILRSSSNDVALDEPRNVLQKHLLKRFPGLQNESHLEEVLNYATNSFLQEFETADAVSICNEILARNSNGTLFRELDQLLKDKHVETSIEAFHDLVAGNMAEIGSGTQETLCRPVFFDAYAAIWQMNCREFRDYTMEAFLEDFSARSRRFSHISGVGEMMADFYCELGLAMNFTKMFRYYEREARRGRASGRKIAMDLELERDLEEVVAKLEGAETRASEKQEEMSEVEEMDKENNHESLYGRYMRAGPSRKLLRFLAPSTPLRYGKLEPPYYVHCEVNGNEFVELS